MKYIALLLIIVQLTAFADCNPPVAPIKTGQTATCDGYVFSKSKATEATNKAKQLDITNQQLDIQAKQLQLYQNNAAIYQDIASKSSQQEQIYQKAATEATEKYINSEKDRGIRDFLFLGLGVVGAYVIASIANSLRK